jgi:hypothetical protein
MNGNLHLSKFSLCVHIVGCEVGCFCVLGGVYVGCSWGKKLALGSFLKKTKVQFPHKKISTKLIIVFVEVKCVQKLVPNIQILSLTFVVSPIF